MNKLLWPLSNIGHTPGVFVTQKFGEHLEDYSPYLGHPGIDIGAPKDTLIYASHDGQATYFVDNGPKGYGNHVEITDASGFLTIYGHMNKFEGAARPVKMGDVIGYVGTTGNSTGFHCHFGYMPKGANFNNGYGGYINPKPFMKIIIPKWVGYRLSPQKDFYLPQPDVDTYNQIIAGTLKLTDLYQIENYEVVVGDRPPFSS